jgi:hypothetical protein
MKMTLYGWVESINEYIEGWAIDFQDIDLRCAIDIFINDKRAFTFSTGSVGRADLINILQNDSSIPESFRSKIDNRALGFRAKISDYLKEGQNRVSVKFNKTGIALGGGEGIIDRENIGIRALRGPNSYIFFTEDKNKTLDLISGVALFDERSLYNYCKNYVVLTRALASKSFCDLFIVPDRAVLAPSEVSTSFSISNKRPSLVLLEHLHYMYQIEAKYPVHIFNNDDIEDLVLRTDSHLSHHANFLLSLNLLEPHVSRHKHLLNNAILKWETGKHYGDLRFFEDVQFDENVKYPVFKNVSDLVFDTSLIRTEAGYTGNIRCTHNSAAPIGVAVVVGTSSAYRMMPFIEQCFQTTFHIFSNDLPLKILKQIRPDNLFVILTERTVHSASLDLDLNISQSDIDRISFANSIFNNDS